MRKEMGIFALGALVAVVLLGASNALNLRDDGIQFTDGTVQTTAAFSSIRLVDSLGQIVGPVVGYNISQGHPVVDFRYDGFPVLLLASVDKLGTPKNPFSGVDPFSRGLSFEYPDCQGRAFAGQGYSQVEVLVGGPESIHAIGPGNILYQWQGGFPEVTVMSYSNGFSCDDYQTPTQLDGYEMTPVLDLDDWFTPPYHIE